MERRIVRSFRPRCLLQDFDASENNEQWQMIEVGTRNFLTLCFKNPEQYNKEAEGRLKQIHTSTELGLALLRWAFLQACRHGNVYIVELMLSWEACPHKIAGDEISPLRAAVLSNSFETVWLLKQAGATVHEFPEPDQDELLLLALKRGLTKSDEVGSERWDAQSVADLDIIKLLITYGAYWSDICYDGYRALSLAVSSQRFSVVGYLLHKKVDVNARDDKMRMTPLMRAAVVGNVEIARLLIQHGADVSVLNSSGHSPLLLAIVFGRAKMVQFLLEQGSDVYQENHDNKNAFTLAAETGRCDIITLLLRHAKRGADANLSSERNRLYLMLSSAYNCAESQGHQVAANLLQKKLYSLMSN